MEALFFLPRAVTFPIAEQKTTTNWFPSNSHHLCWKTQHFSLTLREKPIEASTPVKRYTFTSGPPA